MAATFFIAGVLAVAALTVGIKRNRLAPTSVAFRVGADGALEGVVPAVDVEGQPAASSKRIVAAVVCVVVGGLFAIGAILLQGSVAEGNAKVKAYETASTECVKQNLDSWVTACSTQLDGYQEQTSSTARTEGLRTLLAALGTMFIGYGIGDLVVKKIT